MAVWSLIPMSVWCCNDFNLSYRPLNFRSYGDASSFRSFLVSFKICLYQLPQVASWWDYGYQTTAMANRTVIVDNNTWNNTHIATVGMAMSSPEKAAWEIYTSLDVKYVLVVFGGLFLSLLMVQHLLFPCYYETCHYKINHMPLGDLDELFLFIWNKVKLGIISALEKF